MPGNDDHNTNTDSQLPTRSECDCPCHEPNSTVEHDTPCCRPDDTDSKDGKDYF